MPCRDYISNLPDEILGRILSELPTGRAASTSVLSKRWRNLLPLVHSLDFDDADGGARPDFCDFVDKTLALLTSSPILKSFSLTFAFDYDEKYPVNTWIRTALERGYLHLHLNSVRLSRVETELLRSNTLVELTLSVGHFMDRNRPRGSVLFPALKRLSIIRVNFGGEEIYQDFIFPGCPILEDLYLDFSDPEHGPLWYGVVSSPSLKRLTISYDPSYYRGDHELCRLNTPSLVYLDYSDYVADMYEVHLPSLVEARLSLRSWERIVYENGYENTDDDDDADDEETDTDDNTDNTDFGVDDDGYAHTDDDDDDETDTDDDTDSGVETSLDQLEDKYDNDDDTDDSDSSANATGDITGLVEGLSNVKTLHLSPESLEVLYFCSKSMPVFHNLLTLSIESHKDRGWQALPLLLDNSPNLQTLVIKGLVHHVTNICGNACACIPSKKKSCCLSASRVKVLTVSAFQGTCREMKQMRHFLENLKCLETVKVGVQVNHQRDKDVENKYQRITNALRKLPRVLSNCQIHFF